jgi:hypothetical protein
MLAPTGKTQRVLETIQFVLTFVSVCAVVDATRIHSPSERGAGYYARAPQQVETWADRSITDLARAERKRREAEFKAMSRAPNAFNVPQTIRFD